jgi:succinate dehydrogenase / fumarate reductase, cytochrome b subunit
MSSIKTALTGYLNYRGREGHWSFLLHRITGLGVLLFLFIHIVDTSLVLFNPHLYEEALALYRSTLFGLGEVVIVFCVFYHGVNGLRVAILDMALPEKWQAQKFTSRLVLVIALAMWLPAAIIMLRALLINNFSG